MRLISFLMTQRRINNFNSTQIQYWFQYALGFKNIFASERDSAFSFCVYGEKP